MRIIFLLIVLTGCVSKSRVKDFNFSKSEYERLNDSFAKLRLPESISFSSFEMYCRIIPDIKLPFDFKDNKFRTYSGNLNICLQNSNFGPQGYLPVAKIIERKYISIIYTVPSSSLGFDLYTYNYSGEKLDSANVYFIEDSIAQVDDNCETQISSNMEIKMNYKVFQHDSLNSKKIIGTRESVTRLKINENGKIIKMK